MMPTNQVETATPMSEQIAKVLAGQIKENEQTEQSLMLQLDNLRHELSRLRGAFEGINLNRPMGATNSAIGAPRL